MKFRCVSLLVVVVMLGLASVASADLILNVGLQYQGSWDSSWDNEVVLPTIVTAGPNGTQTTTVKLPSDGSMVYHDFGVYVTVANLTSDQDVRGILFLEHATGAVDGVPADLQSGWVAQPASYGNGTTYGASKPPAHEYAAINDNNGTAYTLDVFTGTSTGGPAGNTYGDYASLAHVGEGGAFLLGTEELTCTGAGTYSFTFLPNPGYLNIISGNTLGAALSVAAESMPAYAGYGDTANFTMVPEPSTLALLGCSLFGLLAYAWRKRK